jgi:hypothetical protein
MLDFRTRDLVSYRHRKIGEGGKMSVSNLSFLDKENYCFVCAQKLDNRVMKLIIDDAMTSYYKPEFMTPVKLDDPIIWSEEIQFCSMGHFITWMEREYEKSKEIKT